MLKKITLAITVAAVAIAGAPTVALAHGHGGYYSEDWRGDGGYTGGYYDQGDYGRPYYREDYRRYRCNDGSTGTIIGAGAGALLGREVARSSGRRYGRNGYYRSRRGNGTTGLLIGGAVGALIGRSIGRSC